MRWNFVLPALVLLAAVGIPNTLRGEVGTACDPLVESPGTDAFIQPGTQYTAWTASSGACLPKPGSECGVGFIVRDPDTGELFATTAGHCFGNIPVGSTLQRFIADGAHGVWGKVVFARGSLLGTMPNEDIALIQIYPMYQDRVSASLYLFGGPNGTVMPGDVAPRNGTVAHSGVPLVPMTVVSLPRVGILEGWNDLAFICTCATSKGDSGSPFVSLADGGKALGLLHGHTSTNLTGDSYVDTATGTHVRGLMFEGQLDIVRAQTAAWANLELVTAPLSDFGRALA